MGRGTANVEIAGLKLFAPQPQPSRHGLLFPCPPLGGNLLRPPLASLKVQAPILKLPRHFSRPPFSIAKSPAPLPFIRVKPDLTPPPNPYLLCTKPGLCKSIRDDKYSKGVLCSCIYDHGCLNQKETITCFYMYLKTIA